jgi:hypothetical protein
VQIFRRPHGLPNSLPRDRDHSSGPEVTFGLKQPTRKRPARGGVGRAPSVSLFGLAPHGVYRAPSVTVGAVRSYRTVSPLPSGLEEAKKRSVLCGTFLRVTATGYYPACCPSRSSDFPPRSLGAIAWPARSRERLYQWWWPARNVAERRKLSVRRPPTESNSLLGTVSVPGYGHPRNISSTPRRLKENRACRHRSSAHHQLDSRTPPERSPWRPGREPGAQDCDPP